MSINQLNRILLAAVISTSLMGLSSMTQAQGHDKGQNGNAVKDKQQVQDKQDKAKGPDKKAQAEQAQGQQRKQQAPQAAQAIREKNAPTRLSNPKQNAAKQTQTAQQKLRLQTAISAAERQQAAHSTQTAQKALRESDQGKQNKNKKFDAKQRLPEQQRQMLIQQQQRRVVLYRQNIAQRQIIAAQQVLQLQQQKRLSQYSYQQQYYERLRLQQLGYQNNNFNYNNDPYFYTASNYRYDRDGRNYETNQYGASTLRQAMNYGYQEGMRAGRADQQDHWRYSYRDSTIYEDANYGYNGYYVQQDDYNYYFRQGFQRGYEDGYYGRRKYGRNSNGSDSLLSMVLNTVLNLQSIR